MLSSFRKPFIQLAVLAVLASIMPNAEARLFKHVNPDTGVTTYSTVPLRVAEPAPALSAPAATAPVVPSADASPPGISSRSEQAPKARSAVVASSMSYPTISAATQRARDNERRIIISDELRTEQDALNEAIARNAAAEIIHRYRANIAALQREIDRLK